MNPVSGVRVDSGARTLSVPQQQGQGQGHEKTTKLSAGSGATLPPGGTSTSTGASGDGGSSVGSSAGGDSGYDSSPDEAGRTRNTFSADQQRTESLRGYGRYSSNSHSHSRGASSARSVRSSNSCNRSVDETCGRQCEGDVLDICFGPRIVGDGGDLEEADGGYGTLQG